MGSRPTARRGGAATARVRGQRGAAHRGERLLVGCGARQVRGAGDSRHVDRRPRPRALRPRAAHCTSPPTGRRHRSLAALLLVATPAPRVRTGPLIRAPARGRVAPFASLTAALLAAALLAVALLAARARSRLRPPHAWLVSRSTRHASTRSITRRATGGRAGRVPLAPLPPSSSACHALGERSTFERSGKPSCASTACAPRRRCTTLRARPPKRASWRSGSRSEIVRSPSPTAAPRRGREAGSAS